MPITVFDVKGVPGHRRERIEAAVVAGGKHRQACRYEAWIAADPFKGGFRLLITGPHGFERSVMFAIDGPKGNSAAVTRRSPALQWPPLQPAEQAERAPSRGAHAPRHNALRL
jgi:hypothetical protein